jgi:hypothetical protein
MNLSRFSRLCFGSEFSLSRSGKRFPERERENLLSLRVKKNFANGKALEKPDASSQVRHPNLNKGLGEEKLGLR